MRRTIVSLAAACFIALSQTSCVLALGAHRHVSGADLPYIIPNLPRSATSGEVVALLGPPTQREAGPDGETLVWREVFRPRACRTYLFGVIPLQPEPREEREVVVRFKGGHLVHAVERHPRAKHGEGVSLLQDTPASRSGP